MELFQEIGTKRGLCLGGVCDRQHYLVANDLPYNMKSRIYSFDPASQRFELLQEIDTSNAADWESYAIGYTTYLAVVNQFNVKSCI